MRPYLDFTAAIASLLAVIQGAIPDEKIHGFIDKYLKWYKEDFLFTMTPEDFISIAYDQIINRITTSEVNDLLNRMRAETKDEVEQEVFTVLIYYFCMVSIPETLASQELKDNNNCFVIQQDPEDKKLGLTRKFRKVPTTLFGRKDLKLFSWPLPDDCDLAFVYNKEGLRMASYVYKGKALQGWPGFFAELGVAAWPEGK